MPYVKQEKRPALDAVVNWMALEGFKTEDVKKFLFEFCKREIKPSYNNYKNYIGELRQCAAEIKRRDLISQELLPFEVFPKGKTICIWPYAIQALLKKMAEISIKVDGDLNYILFKFCKYHILSRKNFCKMLFECAEEIEKKLLAPYEDEKIKENGDV